MPSDDVIREILRSDVTREIPLLKPLFVVTATVLKGISGNDVSSDVTWTNSALQETPASVIAPYVDDVIWETPSSDVICLTTVQLKSRSLWYVQKWKMRQLEHAKYS